MAVSKNKAAPKAKAAPKVEVDKCAECCAKIVSLEKEVSELKSQLAGLLDGINAASKLKAELDEVKSKLGTEVNELKEKAKSWKEKADTNKDGKVDFEEIFQYIKRRQSRWGR